MSSSALTMYPHRRLRRLREHTSIRSIVAETHLLPSDIVAPIFIVDGNNQKQAITSMPGVYRFSIDLLIEEVLALRKLGILAIDLFPCIEAKLKNAHGSIAFENNALCIRAIKAVRQAVPDMCIMADLALDPFTDHGHDGIIDDSGRVLNDPTIDALVQLALAYAEAGADVMAPSDMMDGRVGELRKALDKFGHHQVSILSYAAKYASAFYGPFRDALQSAPRTGDKKGYQLNPANIREALLECSQDELEGADMLMVKPALPYLDVISKLRERTMLPIAAFHVSGEYSMLKAAGQAGWMDADKAMEESLISIKRAGADLILTWAARWLGEKLARGA